MSQNPTYKTGIKTLTDIQLRNGLPSYDILMDKIRVVRENARKISGLPLDGSFENLKYDNFFSILGGRGAGKTSILLTIHNKLRDDANNINVIMPLIMPELIDNGDSFIGWILSAVENELQNIENKIRERGYRKDSGSYAQMCDKYHFFERCTFNNNNTLRNTFSELKKSYYAKVYNSRRGEWDINSDMALVSSINDREFSLVEQFTKFWNQLVSTYQEFYRTSGEDKRVPLIFFMIDDADLKPQIINELIFSLPKYFSHPNVVVLKLNPFNGTSCQISSSKSSIKPADELIVNIKFLNTLTVNIFRFVNLNPLYKRVQKCLREFVNVCVLLD